MVLREMILLRPRKHKKRNDVKLLGAIQISNTSFFVCKNRNGQVSLKTGKEEKLQKAIVKRMIELNPKIEKLLSNYKIKPTIDTRTLKELADGHMNETCRVAVGIYSVLEEKLKVNIKESTIKEASMLHDLGKVLIPSKI